MIRYVHAKGETFAEMQENARKSDLYQQGDMKLVWVNEGDLILQDFAKTFYQSQTGPIYIGDDFTELYEE